MSTQSFTPQGKDPQQWNLAQKIASFKKYFVAYIIINVFLWLLWVFTGAENYGRVCRGRFGQLLAGGLGFYFIIWVLM